LRCAIPRARQFAGVLDLLLERVKTLHNVIHLNRFHTTVN
jgi:hypothetical protein